MSSDSSRRFDPILFEVIRNALVEATEEMSVSIQRSAYSTNVKTRLDYSCAFVDAAGRMVAQAFCQPAHLGTVGRLVPRAVAEYGPENLEPGDALVVNDPHRQASHLNDIFLISPLFWEDEPVGYVANVCHHVDVGGGAPASIGAFREIYQEGVVLPVVKLVSRGEIVPDLWKLVLANVRAVKEVGGDLRSQVAANTIGIRRLSRLLERYGKDTIASYIQKLFDYTEERTRADLARLPPGTYAAAGYLDDDGITPEPVLLHAQVTIARDRVTFDFSGTGPQRSAPMNCNLTQTFTACAYVFKCLIDPDIPVNEGFYQPIHVIAPEGCTVNATHPTAIVGGWEVAMRVCEVLFHALADAMPDRVPAGTKGMICHVGFGGQDPRRGGYYTFLETLAGGYGGRLGSDGPDAVQTHIQNTQNAPIEETELNYPVRVLRYGLVPDSEGPGRYRGGLGLRREYLFPDHEPVFTTLADRVRFPPHGLFGGQPGRAARYDVCRRDGTVEDIPSKGTLTLTSGAIVRVETCGGGGYGPSCERDPDLVVRDVREGKVSVARARDVYGVVIDPASGALRRPETEALRRRPGQRDESA